MYNNESNINFDTFIDELYEFNLSLAKKFKMEGINYKLYK
jgi:hypothetical protein